MPTVNLGVKVRAARKANGLTLRELGELVELSTSYLSDIERGRTDPSFKNVCKLSDLLQIELFPSDEKRLSHEELSVVMAMRNGGAFNAIKMIVNFDFDGYFGEDGE